jgi:hypothetical protein
MSNVKLTEVKGKIHVKVCSGFPSRAFIFSVFFFQVTLVPKTKIIEDDNFLEIYLGRLQRQPFWHIDEN